MTTWCCNDCGLINYDKSNKCIACFTHNHKKFWKCSQCELLNPIKSTKCPACFNVQQRVKIDDKWYRDGLDLRELIPNYNELGGSIFKLISWKNKVYTMFIAPTENKEIIMRLIEHDENASQPKLDPNLYTMNFPRDHIYYQSESFSMDREKSELYFICLAGDHGDDKNTECYLFIYDLNQQKIKNKYELKFVNENLTFNEYRPFKIQIIPNNENNENIPLEQISFNIINYWFKTSSDYTEISLPNDVYILINKFYSLYSQNNSFQMILFNEKKICTDNNGANHYLYALYHGIIDLNAAYNDIVDVQILNKQNLKECAMSDTDDEDIMEQRDLFQYRLSIRIKYDIYVIFRDETWIVNLQNGAMNKTKSLAPPDPDSLNANISTRYDSCNDWNERYLFLILDFDNLLCFDRISKEYIEIVESGDLCDRSLDNPSCPVGWGEQEIMVHGEEMIVAVSIAEIDGVRFVSETSVNIQN